MFHKSVVVLAVSYTAFIAGCASPQPSWRKEGVAAEGARSALAECKYQVGLNKVAEDKQRELITNCMEGKGFRSR
jgi:hypothetical protein